MGCAAARASYRSNGSPVMLGEFSPAADLSLYGPSIESDGGYLGGSKGRPLELSHPRGCRALAPPGLSGILGSFIIISTEVRSLISNWTSGSHREMRGTRGSVASSLLRC